MPINLPVHLNAPSFPAGYCPSTWTEFSNAFAAGVTGYLDGTYNTFNYGSTSPAADDRVKPWLRLNAADGTMDGWYVYAAGAWMRPHEIAPGLSFLQMYYGSSASIDTLDGGSPGVVGNATGPFWAIHTAMEGRSPMGVAPVVTGTATPFPVGTNYGEGQHLLTLAEMPKHTHQMSAGPNLDVNAGGRTLNGTGDPTIFTTSTTSTESGGDTVHNNVHPVRALYFLERTARIFRVAP